MKYLKLGLYLLFLFAIIFPFAVLPRIIKINKIECYSQYGICDNEIFELISPANNKSIRDAKIFTVKQFTDNGIVQDYSFTFKLPGTLRVDIILNKAKFALYRKDSAEVVLIDKDGIVLERVDKTNLPKVVIPGDLPGVGEKVAQDKLFALNLIYSLNFFYQVNYGEITDNAFMADLPEGVGVVFPLEGELKTLLGSLKLVLTQLNLTGKDQGIIVVDLRFKNPIIRK